MAKGKILNVSIVLFNPDFEQIHRIVNTLVSGEQINRIYLIDNSYCENIRLKTIGADYVFSGRNLGYGAGHNKAIQKSLVESVQYHLVLNPDIVLEPAALDELIKYMELNEDIGLIMPRIQYPNGETQYLCKLLPSPMDLIGRRFIPFKQLIKKRNDKYELRFTGYNKVMQVPSLSGCFMMMRTNILKMTNGFDERFFMYCEDLDLSRRIGLLSRTIFYPFVSVTHQYEKGSYKNLRLLQYHILSAFKYFNKWGWFFDKSRNAINKNTLNTLEFNESRKSSAEYK